MPMPNLRADAEGTSRLLSDPVHTGRRDCRPFERRLGPDDDLMRGRPDGEDVQRRSGGRSAQAQPLALTDRVPMDAAVAGERASVLVDDRAFAHSVWRLLRHEARV